MIRLNAYWHADADNRVDEYMKHRAEGRELAELARRTALAGIGRDPDEVAEAVAVVVLERARETVPERLREAMVAGACAYGVIAACHEIIGLAGARPEGSA